MEQRVSLITLGVSDLARSREFYRRLGWRRSMTRAEGVAFFQIGGLALALYPREHLARDAEIEAPGPGFSRLALAYNTRTRDEVDQVLAEAEAAGATILKRGHDVFWGGYVGFFADPDGFLWEIAWNPSFAMSEDGSIRLPE
ncbi:MAG TPA: VOC family protein [Alphaproteobacteria bacterium]|nr:VOC family protein [Alphaproteobacteria bacterium]